jgi:hypothetical protein
MKIRAVRTVSVHPLLN